MQDWKQRLYAGYVSTGQAVGHGAAPARFDAQRYRHITAMLRRVLPAQRDARVLDMACGHGPLLNCAKALGYTHLAGVDVSAEQVALARRLGLAEVVCQGLQEYLAAHAGRFDIVFAMDVLEHLTPPELLACLDAVALALKPGGRVVIHVPNAEGLFGMRMRYGDLTHETAFTATSMTQLLRATGFAGIECHEERPHVHGLSSAVRHLLWRAMTLPTRLLMAAETGAFGQLLSQNMLVTATRAAA
jgi:2-polyprenyl-3-methyl-5-hydroxy-6-metoxy-1,4-benzoquinol methylase